MIWSSFCVAFACGALGAILRAMVERDDFSERTIKLFAFTATAFFIVSLIVSVFMAVVSFLFVFNFWKSIPKKFARTSPGVALGLLFVPLFNLYWSFVTFRGGTLDLDSSLQHYAQNGLNHNERPEYAGLFGGTMFAILSVLMFSFGVAFASLPILFPDTGFPVLSDLFTSWWAAFVLSTIIFLLPLCFAGGATWLWAGLATLSFFGFSNEDAGVVFMAVLILLVSLFFAFYPLLFVFCMRRVRAAALQMNCWRAGVPSEQSVRKATGPRVTLDDIINS